MGVPHPPTSVYTLLQTDSLHKDDINNVLLNVSTAGS